MKVTIQAVEERRGNVERMTDALGDSVDVEVYYDKRRISPLDSFMEMLKIPFSEYRLHLQDDMILPEGFADYLPVLEDDVRENDFDVVALWAPPRKDLRESHGEGVKQYVVFGRFLTMTAVIFSKRAVEQMRLMRDAGLRDGVDWGRDDDFFVQGYLRDYKKTAYVHLPSIVQHNVYMGSTLGHASTASRLSELYEKDFIVRFLEKHKG